MRKFCLFLFIVCTGLTAQAQGKASLHAYSVKTITDSVILMKKYYGKKLLLVNTASFCSYTSQFEELEKLYQAHKSKGFEILGFPSNDFGQDPHSDSTINVFCSENYSVTFQMMSKIAIISGDTTPIYKWLQLKTLNETKDVSVDWNFNKFLINESGEWVAHHGGAISPMDPLIVNWINSSTSLTGIKEVSEKNNPDMIRLSSSNPGNDYFEVTLLEAPFTSLVLELYTFDGRLLKTIPKLGLPGDSQKLIVNTSELPDGIYFLLIEKQGQRQGLKLIVSR